MYGQCFVKRVRPACSFTALIDGTFYVQTDLREIGSGQGDISQGNVVLQIQKLRNIAAPKNNEASKAAPRMLKLSLTDGRNNYQAVELNQISGLR